MLVGKIWSHLHRCHTGPNPSRFNHGPRHAAENELPLTLLMLSVLCISHSLARFCTIPQLGPDRPHKDEVNCHLKWERRWFYEGIWVNTLAAWSDQHTAPHSLLTYLPPRKLGDAPLCLHMQSRCPFCRVFWLTPELDSSIYATQRACMWQRQLTYSPLWSSIILIECRISKLEAVACYTHCRKPCNQPSTTGPIHIADMGREIGATSNHRVPCSCTKCRQFGFVSIQDETKGFCIWW